MILEKYIYKNSNSLEEYISISKHIKMPSWLNSAIPKELLYYPSFYNDYPYWLKSNLLELPKCELLLEMIKDEDDAKQVGVLTQTQGVVQSEKNRAIRDTKAYNPPALLEEIFIELISLHKSDMERFFNVIIHSPSALQVLGYESGSFYARHSDNCSEIVNEKKDVVVFHNVAPHRMLTVILFLTTCGEGDDHTGGELIFDYLLDEELKPLVITPKAGMMLAFPSHPAYSHTVKEIKSGFRISIVQWFNGMVL